MRVEGSAEADWDTPLDDDAEDKRKLDFAAAYDELSFESESTPGAAIIGCLYREFRGPQRQVSVMPLHKMRSEAEFKAVGAVKRRKIGQGLSMSIESEQHVPD